MCLKLDRQGVALCFSSSLLPEKVLRRYKLHTLSPFVSSPGNRCFYPSIPSLRSGEIRFSFACVLPMLGRPREEISQGIKEGFEVALFLFTGLKLSPGSFGSLSWWGCQRPHSRLFLGCHLRALLWGGGTFNLLVFEDLFYLMALCCLCVCLRVCAGS